MEKSGVVLLVAEKGPGFDPGSRTTDSEIVHLLLPSRDVTEITLERRKSSYISVFHSTS